MPYFQAAAGLILLVFAGEYLVRGAVAMAQRMGISTLIIGLTVVAFGTSAPELVVGVNAVLAGAPALALGNVVGSNIANILLVLGLPALFLPISFGADRLGRNFIIMVGATAIFMGMAHTGSFGWPQGAILLSLLVSFLVYSGKYSQEHPEEIVEIDEIEDEIEHPTSPTLSIIMIIAGLMGLVYGADLLVDGAVVIARSWGVSEAVIGLTLVALGTSLPELVTALVAAYRGHSDVAVGGVIGSNIFNLLGIIGVSSIVGKIPVPDSFLQVDLWVMLAATLAIAPFCQLKSHIGRIAGVCLLSSYCLYLFYVTSEPKAIALLMGG